MNKKLVSFLLTGCMAVSMLPAVALADDAAVSDLTNGQIQSEQKDAAVIASGTCGDSAMYTLDNEGTLKIVGSGDIASYTWLWNVPWAEYRSQIKRVEMADTITGIGLQAFASCTALETVSMSKNLQTIETDAFADCTALTSITIPESVTYLGQNPFSNCTGLRNIYYNAVNCGNPWGGICFGNAGKNAPSLVVTIGSGIKRIPNYLFRSSYVTEVKMPDSVEEIGEQAFENCSQLKSVTWSTGLTKIENLAFSGCSNLTNVTIPSGVTSIGSRAFEECLRLTEVNYNAVRAADCQNAFNNAGKNASSLTLTVGSGVQRLPANLFSNTYVTAVSLPAALREIGESAFYNCSSLTEVTIPEGVMNIGATVFEECANLKKVYFRGKAPVMGENMFHGLIATAYYPTNATGWNDVIKNQYGGIITWNNWTPQNVVKNWASDVFTDVTVNDWYLNAVQYVYDNGIMSGTGVAFEPLGTMSRAMVVQTLYNIEGQPAVSGKMPFSDVKSSDWYYNAILWAAQNNVAAGSDGKFSPNSNVTREQFAQFLYNYEGSPKIVMAPSLTKYADYQTVSSWAKTALLWANMNGIVSGKPDGNKVYLDPLGNATRAEAAAMLTNYIKN